MRDLERRVEALESAHGLADAVDSIIIVGLVDPGEPPHELRTVRSSSGAREWTREDGETEEQFTRRASAQARPRDNCVALLLAG